MNRLERDYVFSQRTTPINVIRVTHENLVESHDHDFVEIVLVLRGRAHHLSAEGTRLIQAGDLIILRPGAWHSYQDCSSLKIYNCCFGSELLRRELSWLIEDPSLGYLFWHGLLSQGRKGLFITHLSKPSAKRCRMALDDLHTLLRCSRNKSRPAQLSHLLLFLATLGAECLPRIKEMVTPRKPIHVCVTAGVRLLEENPSHRWTLGEISGRLNIAPTYLVKLFREAIGLPPMAYLGRCRAEWAASLLMRTDRTIGEIAAETGWDSPYYFARRFRAHFGMTASDYRLKWKVQPTDRRGLNLKSEGRLAAKVAKSTK